MRDYGDGLATTRLHLREQARELRNLASGAPAECAGTVAPLRTIAGQLDIAAHEELMMDSGWSEMAEAGEAAIAGAKAFAAEYLKPEFFSPETAAGLDGTMATVAARQDDLTGRIETMIDQCRMEELRSDAGAHGLTLRKAGAFLTMLGQPERGAAIDAIGARLREIEIRETYLDGGQSQQQIVTDIEAANADLQAFIRSNAVLSEGSDA